MRVVRHIVFVYIQEFRCQLHWIFTTLCSLFSLLLHCWILQVVGCWRGYLSGARCRLAYGPADATHRHSLSLASVKSRLFLPFWYWLTRVVLDKWALNRCMSVCWIPWMGNGQYARRTYYVVLFNGYWHCAAGLLGGIQPVRKCWHNTSSLHICMQPWLRWYIQVCISPPSSDHRTDAARSTLCC